MSHVPFQWHSACRVFYTSKRFTYCTNIVDRITLTGQSLGNSLVIFTILVKKTLHTANCEANPDDADEEYKWESQDVATWRHRSLAGLCQYMIEMKYDTTIAKKKREWWGSLESHRRHSSKRHELLDTTGEDQNMCSFSWSISKKHGERCCGQWLKSMSEEKILNFTWRTEDWTIHLETLTRDTINYIICLLTMTWLKRKFKYQDLWAVKWTYDWIFHISQMSPKWDQDRTLSTRVCDISVCVFKEFSKDFRQEMTTMRCYFHRQVRNADRCRMCNCTFVSPVDSEATVITIGYVESIHVRNMTLRPLWKTQLGALDIQFKDDSNLTGDGFCKTSETSWSTVQTNISNVQIKQQNSRRWNETQVLTNHVSRTIHDKLNDSLKYWFRDEDKL